MRWKTFLLYEIFVFDRLLKVIFPSLGIMGDSLITKAVLIIFGTLMLIVLLNSGKLKSPYSSIELIIIGGISNLIDIIFFGRVLDYINIGEYFLNFSDILIFVGTILFFASQIYGRGNKGRK